ncbi:MAG: hypothetical protein ACO1TE_14775 [Prosthecobacter sp.]
MSLSTHSSPHPAEACLHHAFEKVEDYVRREPAKAVATALGAGLLLKLLPTRAFAKPLTAAAATLLPPTLVGLGLIKALELCLQADVRPAGARNGAEATTEKLDGPLPV